MTTIFKFSTGVAIDDEFDYPLKYTFYYTVNNITINIGEFYESMVSTAALPYSGICEYFRKLLSYLILIFVLF